MNLLAVLKENLTDTVVSRAAYYVDENPEKTRMALEGLIQTVVAGLMKRTTTEIGVNQLYGIVQKGKFNGASVASFSDLLRDPDQINRLAETGSNSISHLLPAMKSSIGSIISSYANIKNSSAIGLLGLVTPLVLGVLNQLVQDKKLDADGLATLLADQRDHLVEETPERLLERMAEGLNIQQLLAVGVTPAKRSVPTERPQRVIQERPRFVPETEDQSNGSLAKWGVGALVVLALAGGSYYIWNNTQSYSEANQGEEATSTEFVDTTATAGNAPKTGRPTEGTSTTPGSASVAAGKVSAKLTPYLTNPLLPKGRTFAIPEFDFEPGSEQMKPAGVAAATELATILKNNPQMQIRLVGYANDAIPPVSNKVLSFKRVNVIKQQLVQQGINFIRIDAVGFGTGVRRNDTTAVRKPTRRQIDVKVVAK